MSEINARRPYEPRAKVEFLNRLSKRQRRHLQLLSEDGPDLPSKPRTRAECIGNRRPCPFVSCKWHLFLDVLETGNIKLNFPGLEPHDLRETCALDVADRGDHTLWQVGELMNITGERMRQIEDVILSKLAGATDPRKE